MIIVNDEYKDKYSQSGGGKEEDRAILLVYKQLTDRTEKSPEVIAHLTQQIFEYLRAKANEKLDVLFSQDPSNLSRFKGRVDYILSNYLEEEKEEEKGDFIGRINIISLQLILLFTFALEEIGKLQTDYGFKFIRVVMNILRNHNYLSYHKVKEYIISLKDFEVAKPDTSEMRVVKSLSLL
jgi:hypothetical protein